MGSRIEPPPSAFGCTCTILRGFTVLLLVCAMLLVSGCNPLNKIGAGTSEELQPSLTFSKTHILLENGNNFIWSGVTLTLNSSYSYSIAHMPRGVSSIPLAAFLDAAGEAFDSHSMVPHQLHIHVQSGLDGKPNSFNW